MTDQYVQVPADSTGKKIDVSELTIGANTVERQRVVIGDNSTAANYLAIDAGGNAAVKIMGDNLGLATSAKQDTGNTSLSAINNYAFAIDAKLGNGLPASLGQKTMANSTGVVLASDQSAIPTTHTDLTNSISINALNGTSGQITNLLGGATAAFQITGTWIATLQIQITIDGSTWNNVTGNNSVMAMDTGAYVSGGNISVNGVYQFDVSGMYGVRLICTSYTSGTVTGSVRVTGSQACVSIEGVPTVTAYSPTASNFNASCWQSGTWTVQPGNTANTTPWLVRLSDGTNNGTVKAASTASAFTDVAPVVSVRPGEALCGASAAMADALANPSLGPQSVLNSVYNGSTWDRQRGMSVATTTGDSGAKTATGNGATQTNVGNKGVQIFIVLGTVSGTSPTCVFKIQGSVDGGSNWYDIPSATTASLTASVKVGISIYPGIAVLAGTTTTGTTATCSEILPRTWRVVWTIGGTTPSFTITSITYNYIPN